MIITRKITSIATAAALVATTLGPLATSASAEGWHGRRGGPSYSHSERNWDHGRRHHYQKRYAHRRHHERHHRHHRRDNTGKYIALGVGALMLGIIASEAAHR